MNQPRRTVSSKVSRTVAIWPRRISVPSGAEMTTNCSNSAPVCRCPSVRRVICSWRVRMVPAGRSMLPRATTAITSANDSP